MSCNGVRTALGYNKEIKQNYEISPMEATNVRGR